MDLLRWQSHRYNIDTNKRNIDMTAQDIIDLHYSLMLYNGFYSTIIVCSFLFLILAAVSYYLYQKFQDEKIDSYNNNKSINKLYSQFLERFPVWFAVFGFFNHPDLDSYEEYLITFKGWTAQEVYQKIKEHLESILEEYKNTGKYDESNNHALSNFLAEIRFAQDELCAVDRQKIDTKLSDFS